MGVTSVQDREPRPDRWRPEPESESESAEKISIARARFSTERAMICLAVAGLSREHFHYAGLNPKCGHTLWGRCILGRAALRARREHGERSHLKHTRLRLHALDHRSPRNPHGMTMEPKADIPYLHNGKLPCHIPRPVSTCDVYTKYTGHALCASIMNPWKSRRKFEGND